MHILRCQRDRNIYIKFTRESAAVDLTYIQPPKSPPYEIFHRLNDLLLYVGVCNRERGKRVNAVTVNLI